MNGVLETIDAFVTALVDEENKAFFPMARFITIPAEDQIERSAIRRRVEELLNSTHATLAAMQQYRITGFSGKRRRSKCSIRVALAMSEVEPKRRPKGTTTRK
ncbi:MAG: hypothetical protein CMLOHMNK_00397 [Steroidobacteraceae bacterium]|nr:hypothetical protein [Steroidobacteraceae bacterium]